MTDMTMKRTVIRAMPVLLGLVVAAASTMVDAHGITDAFTGIDQSAAKQLARGYLNSIGYTRSGTSQQTASVGKAELRGGTWIVRVRVGDNRPSEDRIVLVDADEGTIKAKLD